MLINKRFIITCLLIFTLVSCSQLEEGLTEEMIPKQQLSISAAASLFDIMMEVKDRYEEQHQIELLFNFGGTGQLAQKIEEGMDVDIFISADKDWVEYLLGKNMINENTLTNITSNRLVLIAHRDSTLGIESIEDIKREKLNQIAIGDVTTVPAGKYAKNALEEHGKWNEISEKVLYAQNVRQVLTFVETKEAELGFVYESDVLSSNNVKVIETLNETWHEPIIYQGVITTKSEKHDEGERFLRFLTSDVIQGLLEEYEFTSQ